jgi:hypothetical protein
VIERTVLGLALEGARMRIEDDDEDEHDGGTRRTQVLRERAQNTASQSIAASAAQAER